MIRMAIKIVRNLGEIGLTGEVVGFDIETTITRKMDKLAMMQVYQSSDDTSYIIPIRTVGRTESKEDYLKNREILPTLNVVGHYLQFDLAEILYRYGVIPNPVGDTFLISCMMQWENKGLDDLTRSFLVGEKFHYIKEVIDVGTLEWDLDDRKQLEYVASDPSRAKRIHDMIESKGIIRKLGKAYEIDIKALPMFARARANGIDPDMNRYKKLLNETKENLDRKVEEFQKSAGRPAKINSPKDMQRLLFEELGLPETPVRTPTGNPSTNAEALNYLKGTHPCVDLLTEAKRLQSVYSGSKKLPEFIQLDGKLHPEFIQIGFDGTSRVYTTKPSVNQYSRELRGALIPPKGKKFLFFDWKAAELILAAYWAGCEELVKQYQEGDLHRYIALKVLGREEITKEEREKIKVVVFSTLFGSEGESAARSLMISVDEAKGYVHKFYELFPELENLKIKFEEMVKRTSYTKTIYGRPRRLKNIYGDSYAQAKALRQAVNTAIQGSVADMQKVAIAKVANYREQGMEFVIGIFDSILLSIPEEMEEDSYLPILDNLSDFGKLKLKYEYSEGYDWRYCQENMKPR